MVVEDRVTDREVVIFLAELVGTLKKATPRMAYIGDLVYRFDFDGNIIAVSRITGVRTTRLDDEAR